MAFLYFSMNSQCQVLIKQHILLLFFQFISSVKLINSLLGSNFLLFLELINIASTLFYNFIEFIILLYTFLVICFAGYIEYIICLILFSKFSDILLAFTCASAIGNR